MEQMSQMGYNTGVVNRKVDRGATGIAHGLSSRTGGTVTMTHSTRTPSFPANLSDYAPWVSTHGLVAPYGECQCGCGEDAPLSKANDSRWGHSCGLPVRFVKGHYGKIQPVRSARERFWKKVDKRGPGDCWEWQGGSKVEGYGGLADDTGRVVLTHRFSYEIHFGAIPEGLMVCHRCDNPSCCNPNHLFLGTALDNTTDMVAKGRARAPKGIDNGKAKLNDGQVIEIRQRHEEGESLSSIAEIFGVTDVNVGSIIRRKTWSHV